jgi:hypothetical protein
MAQGRGWGEAVRKQCIYWARIRRSRQPHYFENCGLKSPGNCRSTSGHGNADASYLFPFQHFLVQAKHSAGPLKVEGLGETAARHRRPLTERHPYLRGSPKRQLLQRLINTFQVTAYISRSRSFKAGSTIFTVCDPWNKTVPTSLKIYGDV